MARQHRGAAVDIEHRHGKATLTNVHPKLEVERPARTFRRKPSSNTGLAGARVDRRGYVMSATGATATATATSRRSLHRGLLAAAPSPISPSSAFSGVAAGAQAVICIAATATIGWVRLQRSAG